MKKIKLVVSDFHIGPGRYLPDGSVNLLEDFNYDSYFIDFLEFYSRGPYANADVELIINGDFLNTLQVDYEEQYPSRITELVAVHKVQRVLTGHPELFTALKRFAATPNHRITYLFGNHDPAFLWQGAREVFNDAVAHDVQWPTLVYEFDGFYLEHGNQYEAANRYNPEQFYIYRNIPEPILNLPWGAHFVIEYLNQIKKERPYVDKVRPFESYLRFALVHDFRFGVRSTAQLVKFFLGHRLLPNPYRISRFLVTLKIIWQSATMIRYEKFAERILKRDDIHTVILGHSHQYLFRQYAPDKVYLNTGTWNDIIRLDIENMGRHRDLTYAFIDYDHPRPVAQLKEWQGTWRPDRDVIF